MDINRMIIRSGDLALWDGLRYSVPVKVLSITGTGELNGTTRMSVRVTTDRGPWKRGEVLDANGTEVYTRVRCNGKYRNPAALVTDDGYCPAHTRDIERTPVRQVADRDQLRWECDHRKNCGA